MPRTSDKPKAYACACGKAYTASSNLSRHKKTCQHVHDATPPPTVTNTAVQVPNDATLKTSVKEIHTQTNNNVTTTDIPCLTEYVARLEAKIETLMVIMLNQQTTHKVRVVKAKRAKEVEVRNAMKVDIDKVDNVDIDKVDNVDNVDIVDKADKVTNYDIDNVDNVDNVDKDDKVDKVDIDNAMEIAKGDDELEEAPLYDADMVECCKTWKDGGFVQAFRIMQSNPDKYDNQINYRYKCDLVKVTEAHKKKNDTPLYTKTYKKVDKNGKEVNIHFSQIKDEGEYVFNALCDAWYDFKRSDDYDEDIHGDLFDDDTDYVDVMGECVNARNIDQFMN